MNASIKILGVVLGTVIGSCAAANDTAQDEPTREMLIIPADPAELGKEIQGRDPVLLVIISKNATTTVFECGEGCMEKNLEEAKTFRLLDSGGFVWTKEGKYGGDPCIKLKSTSGAVYERCW